jgi:DnaJ like chaperone protein
MKPTTQKLLLLLWIAYLLIPVDLIPDWLGWLGRIDDLLLLGYLLFKIRKDGQVDSGASRPANENAAPEDPWSVLEVPSSASWEEVDKSYRRLASLYHPDKVNHLGAELKKVAHEKMLKIQSSYEVLRNRMKP